MKAIYVLPLLFLTACNGHRLVLMYEEGAAVGVTQRLVESQARDQTSAPANVKSEPVEQKDESSFYDSIRSTLP